MLKGLAFFLARHTDFLRPFRAIEGCADCSQYADNSRMQSAGRRAYAALHRPLYRIFIAGLSSCIPKRIKNYYIWKRSQILWTQQQHWNNSVWNRPSTTFTKTLIKTCWKSWTGRINLQVIILSPRERWSGKQSQPGTHLLLLRAPSIQGYRPLRIRALLRFHHPEKNAFGSIALSYVDGIPPEAALQ